MRERNLNGKTGGDDAEQSHHEGFDPAEAQMLHSENEKHVKRRDDHTDLQRNPEQKIKADGSADHLSEIGRADRDLSEQPKRPRQGGRKRIATGLREIAASPNA